ncbi:MAG: SRPBCC domain-containing protein, partial [Bacteroidota bacterium]
PKHDIFVSDIYTSNNNFIEKIKIMKSIKTEIQIKATPAQVWTVLADFKNYKNWNPFIHIEGVLREGNTLRNTIYLEGQSPQLFTPVLTKVESGKSFRWLGKLWIRGLFDGEHYFELMPTDDGYTRFIHGENFSGLLVGLLLRMIGDATQQSFIKMNEALKEKVEQRYTNSNDSHLA